MTSWQIVVAVLTSIVLFGAVVTALPPIWRFIKAVAKAPVMVERIADGFGDGDGNLHKAIVGLTDSTDHLRASNHDIANKLTKVIIDSQILGSRLDQHLLDDTTMSGLIISRLDSVDSVLMNVQQLDREVKADLTKFNEIDQLGREGKIERRTDGDG